MDDAARSPACGIREKLFGSSGDQDDTGSGPPPHASIYGRMSVVSAGSGKTRYEGSFLLFFEKMGYWSSMEVMLDVTGMRGLDRQRQELFPPVNAFNSQKFSMTSKRISKSDGNGNGRRIRLLDYFIQLFVSYACFLL
jgi:hypothetical protein